MGGFLKNPRRTIANMFGGNGTSTNAPYTTESRATISAAQINASDVTGVQIIAAPGANKVVLVTGFVAVYKGLTTGFTTAGVLKMTYDGLTDIMNLFDGTQLATTDTIPIQSRIVADNEAWVSLDIVNKPVTVIADAAISGGAGSIVYIVSYITLDFN